jgi:hypothetical protein
MAEAVYVDRDVEIERLDLGGGAGTARRTAGGVRGMGRQRSDPVGREAGAQSPWEGHILR